MKALQYSSYGGPDNLDHVDLPIPEVTEGRIRVRIEATGINPADWHMYQGDPRVVRLAFPFRKTGPRIPGADIAGVVDAIGPGVQGFSVGDRVWGEVNFGGCAEFVAPEAKRLTQLPDSVTTVDAAATAMGALTALTALRLAPTVEGARVLVTSASGGVGHLGAQIARLLGASRVVGVASPRHTEWIGQLGLDRVIDYTSEKIGDAGEQFDIVLDTHSTIPMREFSRIIAAGGLYATIGSPGRGVLGPITAMFSRKLRAPFLPYRVEMVTASESTADLDQIGVWLADGRLKPRIECVFDLADAREAFTQLEAGHVGGKLVITP